MADDTGAGGEGGGDAEGGAPAGTTAAEESADLGFYNRKLHNFPLVRVSFKVRSCSCRQELLNGVAY